MLNVGIFINKEIITEEEYFLRLFSMPTMLIVSMSHCIVMDLGTAIFVSVEAYIGGEWSIVRDIFSH